MGSAGLHGGKPHCPKGSDGRLLTSFAASHFHKSVLGGISVAVKKREVGA